MVFPYFMKYSLFFNPWLHNFGQRFCFGIGVQMHRIPWYPPLPLLVEIGGYVFLSIFATGGYEFLLNPGFAG